MAIRRRYKYNKRRSIRRRGYKFTRSNLYNKRSAKQQSYQIYRINKKINTIEKLTKPEIKTVKGTLEKISFYHNGSPDKAFSGFKFLYKDHVLDDITGGMQGDLLRPQSCTLYGNFMMNTNFAIQKDYAEIDNSKLIAAQTSCAYLRIVVCRVVKGSSGYEPTIFTSSSDPWSATSAYQDLNPIFGPLIKGLGNQVKVLKDKIYKVKPDNMCRGIKIRLSSKDLGIYHTVKATSDLGRGEIIVYYQYVCPNMLKYLTAEQTYIDIAPECIFNLQYNMAYVDES